MKFVIWALLLMAQAASNTLVSRARNSSSLGYHAVASVGSNGVWFVSQLILIDVMTPILRAGATRSAVAIGLFYAAVTMIGSVGMHYVSMHYIETGKRRVGA